MESFTLALSLCFCLSDEFYLGYSAKADRSRFPPDHVLNEWRAANYCRRQELEMQRNSVSLLTCRPAMRYKLSDALTAEMDEVDRISTIMMWIIGEQADEYTMRFWMNTARRYMTDDEYRRGYVSWGGLPQ